MVLGPAAILGDPLQVAPDVVRHRPAAVGELLLREQAGLDPLGELDLLLGVEERDLADLLEVILDRVRRRSRDRHLGGGQVLVVVAVDEGLVLALLGGACRHRHADRHDTDSRGNDGHRALGLRGGSGSLAGFPGFVGLVRVIGHVVAGLEVDVLAVGVILKPGQIFQVDLQVGHFGQIGIAIQVFDRSEFGVIVQVRRLYRDPGLRPDQSLPPGSRHLPGQRVRRERSRHLSHVPCHSFHVPPRRVCRSRSWLTGGSLRQDWPVPGWLDQLQYPLRRMRSSPCCDPSFPPAALSCANCCRDAAKPAGWRPGRQAPA